MPAVRIHSRSRINLTIIATVSGVLLSAECLGADGHADWGYEGDIAPEHWAELSPEYAACGIGVNQSPVDITYTVAAELETLVFDYRTGSTDIVNNGHTLQVNAEPGSTLEIRGEIFQFEQLHFHSPSEHRIDGESFPLEAHLVHRNERGFLAVVAILFREGEWNADVEAVGKRAPEAGYSVPITLNFEELRLYENHDAYYRYSGSLTTPPCTEGVRWYVLKTAETVSPQQAAKFVEFIGADARGPQPLNARVVLEH